MELADEGDEVQSSTGSLSHSNAKTASHRSGELVKGSAGVGNVLEDLADEGKHHLARVRKANGTTGPVEDPDAEFSFEPSNLVAQC